MQIFENDEFGKVGIIMIDDKPYFPATKCAKILGYAKPEDAVTRHCRYSVKHGVIDNLGRNREANFVSEGDLYRLIIRSKLPEAEKFEKWVFDEVLPTIRKQGMYITESALKAMLQNSGLFAPQPPQLSDYNNAAKIVTGVMTAANVPPENIAITVAKIYAPLEIEVALNDMSIQLSFSPKDIAEMEGMMSLRGKPHFQAVGAIISMLNISDEHRIITPFQNGETVTVKITYDEYVADAVSDWVVKNGYPEEIPFRARTFKVRYKHLEQIILEGCE